MPRPRKPENRGLPKRWRFVRNAYYYQVPAGQEPFWDGKKTFRLGKTLTEAYREWSARLETLDEAKTVNDLLDRYSVEVIPHKAAKTRTENTRYITMLRKAFGHMPLHTITPQAIYQYVDARSKVDETTGKGGFVAAKREVSLFSHVYTKAVQWGYLDRHPFKGQVRLEGETPRTRYVEDWEVIECLALPSIRKRGSVLMVQAYIKIKLLTGMRRNDLLHLTLENIREDGIFVRTTKKGRPVIYEWSEELRKAIDEAKSVRPVDISPYLFCNKRGKCYVDEKSGVPSGWDSLWRRFMNRVLKETEVTDRFTEHDLRAKCASDALTLDHAQKLLAHADSRITEKVYRRKPEKVKPLR